MNNQSDILTPEVKTEIERIYNRLELMRNIEKQPKDLIKSISKETLDIYVPLAERLGIIKAQVELADLGLRYYSPEEYSLIKLQLQDSEANCSMIFNTFRLPVCSLLDDLKIKYTFTYRMKSVYSIWHKIKTKNVTFDEVYDLFATRIVFEPDPNFLPNIDDERALSPDFINKEKLICWRIYTVITSLYRIHPDRIRDWITHPKSSGYEALQITAMGPDCNWIEIQIRSARMNDLAENGVAAHWRYKAN